MQGTLSIVATPIGNLQDITLRALDVLKKADIIFCEDTRVTRKLLSHFGINTQTESYHQHSSASKTNEIIALLNDGKNIALTTDAGTPGISDPGSHLISEIIKNSKASVSITPVPGPSAVIAALCVSGFPADKFTFFGFPPNKTKRKKFFEELAQCRHTAVIYESSHRILKTIEDLNSILKKDTQLCILRELTKHFETIYRGTILEISETKIPAKGEFVIVIALN